MDTLSSCYFCGAALDEPLSTYRIGQTDASAVCLCRGCRRKVETVLAAAGVDEAVLSESPEGTAPGDEPTTVERDGQTESSAPATVERDDPLDEEPITPEADASDILVDPETDAGSPDGAASEDEEAASDVPDGFGTVDIGGDEGSDDGPEESTDDTAVVPAAPEADQHSEPAESDEQLTGEPGTASDDDPAGRGEPESTGDTEGGDLAARTTLTALEYNKVMRLLQNREFPVDREEIETVASNAYELRRSECAEVIDLAVDPGLIDEQEGELRRPVEE